MAILPIVIYGESVLRTSGRKMNTFGDDLRQLVLDMIETAKAARGVGLAAQQINRLERVIIIDLSPLDETQQAFALINPEVIWASADKVTMEEGCLSFPGLRFDVERAEAVKIKAQTIDGQQVELNAEGFLARVLQHEIDHINGRLFIDHLHPLKKKFILKNWEKSRSKE